MSYPFNPANLWTTSRYMQRSTYGHDYTQQGISPRHRPGNMPYNASLKADIPAGSYRPHGYGAMDPSIRDIDGQRYESGPLTERRRYENAPQTDRGDYYMDRRRDISPERHRDISPGRYDRGRNGSPERYDRGRNGSPERFYDRDRNGYHDRFEKQYDVMDGYANRKFTDRTTYKDYGEFMQEKIKQDELRRNQLDYPTQDFQPALTGGVYLFIRTNKDALVEVRKALQESRTVLANSGGQLKGIAHADQIHLLEGKHGWNVRIPVVRSGGYWLEKTEDKPIIEDIITVIEFSSTEEAWAWLRKDDKFKTSNFPMPNGSQIFTAAINFRPSFDFHGNTFIMIEYPKTLGDQIISEIAPRIRQILGKRLGSDNQIPVECSKGKDIKLFRGPWVHPKSTLICLRFKSEKEAKEFWEDDTFQTLQKDIRSAVDKLPWYSLEKSFYPTAVRFTLCETRV